jgi:hypothetical protein
MVTPLSSGGGGSGGRGPGHSQAVVHSPPVIAADSLHPLPTPGPEPDGTPVTREITLPPVTVNGTSGSATEIDGVIVQWTRPT